MSRRSRWSSSSTRSTTKRATLTYDVELLATWHDSTDFGFTPSTLDAAALPETFGPAHLFIDDGAQGDVFCLDDAGAEVGRFDNGSNQVLGWTYSSKIGVCVPFIEQEATSTTQIVVSYANLCNTIHDACFNACDVAGPVPYL